MPRSRRVLVAPPQPVSRYLMDVSQSSRCAIVVLHLCAAPMCTAYPTNSRPAHNLLPFSLADSAPSSYHASLHTTTTKARSRVPPSPAPAHYSRGPPMAFVSPTLTPSTTIDLVQQPRRQFAQPRGFPPLRALGMLDVLQRQSRRYAATLGEALCCPSRWIEPCSSSARAAAPTIYTAPSSTPKFFGETSLFRIP
jgi:hypothetical protein